MPLIKSTSRQNIQRNIQELVAANASKPADKKRPMKQIEAIAYNAKGKK